MAERTLAGVCKKFSANVFHENKCQNCFKPRDVHQEATSPTRPTTLSVTTAAPNRQKTTIKSGNLSVATQISTLPDVRVQTWEKVWIVLSSSGDLEWFAIITATGKPGQTALGSINLDDCIGLTSAEVETNEPFSIGIKTPLKYHYLKAENRLEMDNWCRVLKPFVLASPGYNFNTKSTAARSLSIQDTKTNSRGKSSASRTVSAPLQSSDGKTGSIIAKSELDAVNEESVDGGRKRRPKKLEPEAFIEKETTSSVETIAQDQPYYSEKYLTPDTPEKKVNGKIRDERRDELEVLLIEARRQAKLNEGKAEICTKDLADTKKSLQKANNMISIQKANMESLKSEIEILQVQLKNENTEKEVKELENGLSLSGMALSPGSVEAGFLKLQVKLQENEEALIRRTRELEKANESRAKVAKHTRSLLLELESKLNVNNRRIVELEEQLLNRTLDLQYEKEERERIEREKGKLVQEIGSSKEYMKQREITKMSTELLEQAKQDHLQLKSSQKSHTKHQEEIESLRRSLESKENEVERLRRKMDKNNERLEDTLKKSQEESVKLSNDLKSASVGLVSKQSECSDLEKSLKDLSAERKEWQKELAVLQSKKDDLESELENERRQHDEQMLLLQEDNEKTRDKLQEVKEELNSLRSQTDELNDTKVPEWEERLRQWKKMLRESQNENEKLRNIQEETLECLKNEKNKRLEFERDLASSAKELERSQKLQEEVLVMKDELVNAENAVEEGRVRIEELENVLRQTEEEKQENNNATAEKTIELEKKLEDNEIELRELEQKLYDSEEKVLSLAEELENRLKVEEEAFGWVENVENDLMAKEKSLLASKEIILLKSVQLDKEKSSIVDAVKYLGGYVSGLESSVKVERSKVIALEDELAAKSKCNACDERESEKLDLVVKLERTEEELEQLKESTIAEVQSLKGQSEDIKLKLSSKVMLLQSDISELKAKREKELREVNEELLVVRKAKDELQARSDDNVRLSDRIKELDDQLKEERTQHAERITLLKSEYEASKRTKQDQQQEQALEDGIVSSELLEQLQGKHAQEIEELKERHRKELEGNKSDMMMVLQALKSDSYQSSQMSNESIEANDQLNKHDRYVENLKQDHEKEIDQLKKGHEQDLQQLRSDMVTLLRVQETYKSPGSGGEQPVSDNGSLYDLNRQLESMRQHYEREAQEKDERHKLEVEQLKEDMLVAIQAASISGTTSVQIALSSKTVDNDRRVQELQEKITNMEKEFETEREVLQNTIKKAESATKFGLRRNEEMSNKIYQMQREMEEIDAKYQKELKMYKEAFDEDKATSSTGESSEKHSETESMLKVKLQELELSMEQMQVRYDAEIKRYKEKFQQENVLTVEELQFKIESLEDTIQQMRLEHANELDRYTKAVKRGKVSLTGTAKERDLERKIDDLESKIDVMRQKHREDVRKYRERLEDERKDLTEARAKLRKLDTDSRVHEDLKSKITELESKNSKLNKDTSKCKELEAEVNELQRKNRELARNVESLKRKLEKLEEADNAVDARTKLTRYTSCDNVTVATGGRTKGQVGVNSTNAEDTFEMNNNLPKTEIGGYKLNPGLKRPASIASFPSQNEVVTPLRRSYSEKRREASSSRPYAAAYQKSATSTTKLR